MEFFGMGMWEILVILVVALVVLGPGRITEVGRTMGKIVRTLRKASFDLTAQVTKELEEEKKEKEKPAEEEPEDKPKDHRPTS